MGVFDGLGKKMSDLGQQTVAKTKEWSDMARVNSLISEEQKKIDNNYSEIGKLYVAVHASDCEGDFAAMVAAIAESEAKIKDYKKQIQDIKGVQYCEKCGAEVPNGVAFCSSCGSPMPKAEQAEMASDLLKCESCGAMIQKGMRFCSSCGKPVAAAETSAAESPIAEAPATETTAAEMPAADAPVAETAANESGTDAE